MTDTSRTRPNLFDHATSELSQDAFLCWLCQWADPRFASTDTGLHRVAVAFLQRAFESYQAVEDERNSFFGGPSLPAPINVRRQVKHVDLIVEVGDTHVLVIEDKTGTKNHSNQLENYEKAMTAQYSKGKSRKVAYIFLKTGDQHNYADVREKGWAVITRDTLLEVLQCGSGIQHDVFLDFVEHLAGIEASFQSYRTVPVADWGSSRPRWRGFHSAIQDELKGGWHYVANQLGGFEGFWWGWCEIPHGKMYLQIDSAIPGSNSERLVIKVNVPEADHRRFVRDHWYQAVREGRLPGFRCPRRRGYGQYMTVGVCRDDFRATDSLGLLDLEATVAILKQHGRSLEVLARKDCDAPTAPSGTALCGENDSQFRVGQEP